MAEDSGPPRTAATRWAAALAAGWAGVLLCIAVVAAPAAFATLAVPDAGRVVGRIFAQEAWFSLALALFLLGFERRRAHRAAVAGSGSEFSAETGLLLGTMFCTVAGYFAIQPMLAAARAGQGTWSFGALHALSSALFALKAILIVALAWRASRR